MPSESRFTPDRVALIGALVAAAVYCRDLRYDFLLDDLPLIMMNQTITSWRNWKAIFVTDIFSPMYGSGVPAIHYRPIYVLWLMINHQLFGSVLPWWHLTSLLLHLGVTLLVYKLGVEVLKEPWTAVLASMLFAFHPIHVESVSYVSASTDMLAALFVLISFLFYLRFREAGASTGDLIASVLAAALAILSKETAAVFPFLLVAHEAFRRGSPTTDRWKRFMWTLPFFGVVAAYAIVRTMLFGINVGPGPGGSRLAALVDAPLVLLVYLHNLLWSFRLSFFYPVEWSTQWTFAKGLAVILVVALAIFLWNRNRNRPGVRLQLLWMGILFVIPVAGVFTFLAEDRVHDRHMYLVSIPLCLIAAALLTDPILSPKASVLASSLVLAVLLIQIAFHLPRFSNEMTLYRSTLEVAPRNALAHRYYASALWNFGRQDEALAEYGLTVELWPDSPQAHENYAAALAEAGRVEEAEREYSEALQRSTGPTLFRASVLYRLAMIEVNRSEPDQAAAHAREALHIDPQATNDHAVLAQALRQQGREQEADEEMRLETSARLQQRLLPKRPTLQD